MKSIPLTVNHDIISFPRLLMSHELGCISPNAFENHMIRKRSAHFSLLTNRPVISTQISPTPLTSLELSGNQRFLLAGNESGGVFLYDLSKWGRNTGRFNETTSYHGLTRPRISAYEPVGHAQQGKAKVRRAQWHGDDTILFVTASADGRVVAWDTNALEPVLEMKPFPRHCTSRMARQRHGETEEKHWPISSMDKNTHSPDQIVVSSSYEACIKLIDLRSASCSHSLIGHSRGCSVARWSPQSPYSIASGDVEGNILIWDVRRASSCLCALQRDHGKHAPGTTRCIRPVYGHLRRNSSKNPTKCTQIPLASSGFPIEQLAFDAHGQFLVSLSNRTLTLWDMLQRTPYVPRQYSNITAANHRRPVLITPNGRSDYIVWVGDKRLIKGYSLQGGGSPVLTLKGHLGNLTDIISKGTELISTGRDQVILQWGQEPSSRKRKEQISDHDNW